MPESLGEKLRQAREEKGISISEVSEQTRISPLYLESIENDDYRTLPGGIFNKGFVKSFAKYVGVDEDEALQDYARLMSSQLNDPDEEDNRSYRPQVLTDETAGPSMIPTIIFAAIILGLMTWATFTLVNWWQSSENNGNAVTDQSNTNTAVNASNTNANPGNTNVNGSNEPPPALDEIKVEIRTTAEQLSVETITDGKRETSLVSPDDPLTIEAKESVRISYYKGLAETVGLTVNGRKIETPLPPADLKRVAFEYEIDKDNLKTVLESGKIQTGASSGSDQAAGSPDGTAPR